MKIGILISGRGSNMMALADAISAHEIPGAEIVLVVSDHADAGGLRLAGERGLETRAIERGARSRVEHDALMIAALRERGAELVCLAGYMRLLSPQFIEAFRGRILNIHPSLLPSFTGLGAQEQALRYGVKWTGCTVHLVDETLDGGPVLAQAVVAVRDDDTVETLSARILTEEHRLYPQTLASVVRGDYEREGRRVFRKAGS